MLLYVNKTGFKTISLLFELGFQTNPQRKNRKQVWLILHNTKNSIQVSRMFEYNFTVYIHRSVKNNYTSHEYCTFLRNSKILVTHIEVSCRIHIGFVHVSHWACVSQMLIHLCFSLTLEWNLKHYVTPPFRCFMK
jgi:hypothetical protein